MTDNTQDQGRVFNWGLPASVAVHLLVLAILVLGLPEILPQSPEEQAVEVELVPPEEESEPEPPTPAEDSAEEEEAKASPPAGDDAGLRIPEPILNPVFQFGEDDTGPREALDGNSAQDAPASDEAQPEEDQQDPAAPPELTAEGAEQQVPVPGEPETAEQVQEAEPESAVTLEEARTLFSRSANGNPVAMTAMRNLPRDMRGGQLCVTELREQLFNAWPPYAPDLLPTQRLESGNVIDAMDAAFRQNGEWYELGYRCEVDADATRVVAFAYRVGDRIPRNEWARRGLPVR